MKTNTLLPFLAALIAFAGLPLTASAQNQKFGTVDLTRVITEFYEFKMGAADLQKEGQDAQQLLNQMLEARRRLTETLQQLQTEAQDPVRTEAEKQQKAAEFGEKRQELMALEREFQETKQRRQRQIMDSQNRMFTGIREQVIAVVQAKAQAEGYTFVMDKSALGLTRVQGLVIPIIIHSSGAIDISDELIVQLNKDAPPEAANLPNPALAPPAAPAGGAAPAPAPLAPQQ